MKHALPSFRIKGHNSGVTLIELLVGIVVLAILVSAATPSIQTIIKNGRVTAQSNELSSLLSFARSEATRLEAGTEVLLSSNGDSWSVQITDPSSPTTPLRSAQFENVQLGIVQGGTLPISLEFTNRGILEQGQVTLSLQHSDCSGNRQRRTLQILRSGVIRADVAACAGGG